MQKLKATQVCFYQAIFKKNLNNLDFVSSSYASAKINVYRQTIFENMCNALFITFPGVWKLLGEECAKNAAYTFCQDEKNLPLSGCLDDWGRMFPDFLRQQKELGMLPYLGDYAFYEWIKHQSYVAQHVLPIKANDLKNISEDLLELIGLSFLPSAYTFSSDFPLYHIEEIIENPLAENINLNVVKSYVVIARPEDSVLAFWISEDLYLFVRCLEQGLTLLQAFRNVEKQYAHFDLTEAILFLIQNKLIYKINLRRGNL